MIPIELNVGKELMIPIELNVGKELVSVLWPDLLSVSEAEAVSSTRVAFLIIGDRLFVEPRGFNLGSDLEPCMLIDKDSARAMRIELSVVREETKEDMPPAKPEDEEVEPKPRAEGFNLKPFKGYKGDRVRFKRRAICKD